jgi:hypothetical protein
MVAPIHLMIAEMLGRLHYNGVLNLKSKSPGFVAKFPIELWGIIQVADHGY